MADEPWLDCCSEDWVSQPRSSINSLPIDTTNASRRSSSFPTHQQNRIPLAVTRSNLLPSNIHTRKTLSPSPLPDQTENIPISGKQCQDDISYASHGTIEYGTTQVKPSRGSAENGTPEWKRRVIRGEISAGEQCDLFGPLGLENIFKPPPTEPRSGLQGFQIRNRAEQQSLLSEAPNSARQSNESTSRITPRNGTFKSTLASSLKGSPANGNYTHASFSKDDTRLRTVSGREELRNEGISPIFLTRNNASRDQTDYAPLNAVLGQLEERLGQSPLKDARRQSSGASDDGVCYDQEQDEDRSIRDENILEMTCQSLPEDLSMGTQESCSNAGYANFRRSGSRNEISLPRHELSQSSISRLSSSAYQLNSHIPSSPPLQPSPGSSQRPDAVPVAAPTPPQVLGAAHRLHSFKSPSPAEENISSGSPLKLFGNHDTFTNNKLLRRMSQFEETLPSESDKELGSPIGSRKADYRARMSRKDGQESGSKKDVSRLKKEESHTNASKENSDQTDALESFQASDSLPSIPPFPGTPNRAAGRGKDSHLSTRPSPSEQRPAVKRGYRPTNQSAPFRKRPQAKRPDLKVNTSDAKRVLNTPAKDSTPKRRRTLQRAVTPKVAQDGNLELTAKSNAALSYITGQKVKSHQQDRERIQSQKETSKSPQEPRPRTPPGRDQSPQHHDVPRNHLVTNCAMGRSRIDPAQTQVSNDISGSNHGVTGARKGSITTQDFLDEATKIMSIIRAKGRPRSALESVDESCAESNMESDYISMEESSQEEFSRPPSREGVDIRKARVQPKQNPRIVSHLRKYQEKDDVDLLMSASIVSLRLDRGSKRPENGIAAGQTGNDEDKVESSPKNIRIRENISHQNKTKDITEHAADYQDVGSMNTRSSRSSTARSIPTGSSSGSGDRGIISSNMVAHLIPEQIGGMTYDRTNHTWIKGHVEEDYSKPRSKSRLSTSEADPFEDIPDLSVDELQELIRAQKLAARTNNDATPIEPKMHTDGNSGEGERRIARSESSGSRPQTRDGNPTIPLDTSSVQSKVSHFNFSGPKPETRATSWGTEDLDIKPSHRPQATLSTHSAPRSETLEQPPVTPSATSCRTQDREEPIAATNPGFPSPISSTVNPREDSQAGARHASMGADSAPEYNNNFVCDDNTSTRNSYQPSARTLPRRASLDGRPFIGRPISRIDEQNEDSLNQELSVVRRDNQESAVSTLPQNHELSVALPPNSGPDTSYSFNLTTLPDFTVNQVDQPLHLEVSYVAQRTNPTSLRQVHGTFALATEELVKHITDVEPYEPYWDHVQQLDLRDKGLITLHQLSEFCPRLEELDISNNSIGQLSGVPSTIRNLRVQHNCLSSLTAWGHLSNLQYLDVSGNDLENLDGFSGLVHLRELNANGNKVENINGILGLNGLLSLKLKGNSLTSINFEGAKLGRLNDVDLSGNQLISVHNLDALTAIGKLDLSENNLRELTLSTPHHNLHTLKLSDNHILDLDLTNFAGLQLLYLDRNNISVVTLEDCRNLEVLSVREQNLLPSPRTYPQGDHVLDVDVSSGTTIRKLYLSSNTLSQRTLASPTAVPSLQLLDLASCAIQVLPENFGTRFPNLRALNLNFNALSDVGELLGISRLSRLTLVGNRVARLRRLCQVLNRIGGRDGYLKKVDLRGNPVTVGFYPPAISGSGRTIPRPTKKIKNSKAQGKGAEELLAITNMGHCADIAYEGAGVVDRVETRNEARTPKDTPDGDEIDDPYTLPLADVESDRKYVSHLDEGTRLRRKVVELMISSATAGRVKILDGLPLIGEGGDGSDDNDTVLKRLKELQIFRRKEASESGEI